MLDRTPLERDAIVDRDLRPAGPNFESLLTPSRFDTPAYWYGLARTNASTLRTALVVIKTSEPGSTYRADAIETVRRMRREIAMNVQHAASLTR